MGIFDAPMKHGYKVSWFTGETETKRGIEYNVSKSCYFKYEEKEKATNLYNEKKKQGLVVGMCECFY